MKTLTALLFMAGLMQAQDIHIEKLGPWPICESPDAASAGYMCSGFKPGHELYILEIQTPADDRTTIAYRYTVTGVSVETGKEVTVSGLAERLRFASGYTGVKLDFGGIATGFVITVQSLAVTGVSQ